MKELRMNEMMEVNGGNNAVDALCGTLEIAAAPVVVAGASFAGPGGTAAGVAVAAGMVTDGWSHLVDATS